MANNNETTKSRFVFPDRLYARTRDNKTLDLSYAPQSMEAVEYIRADRLTHNTNPEKARQRALERCPKSDDPVTEMRNERKRHVFIEGYTQGQQDLALTWQDVSAIHWIMEEIFRECVTGQHEGWSEEMICAEALRRFNESRSK